MDDNLYYKYTIHTQWSGAAVRAIKYQTQGQIKILNCPVQTIPDRIVLFTFKWILTQ